MVCADASEPSAISVLNATTEKSAQRVRESEDG
jgi:hypothetical protein